MKLVKQEVVKFFSGVVLSTEKSLLDWVATADPDILVAVVGRDKTLRLERLAQEFKSPEFVLELLVGTTKIFEVRPGDLSLEALPTDYCSYDSVYPLFEELWTNASMVALEIPSEVADVGDILWSRINHDGGR